MAHHSTRGSVSCGRSKMFTSLKNDSTNCLICGEGIVAGLKVRKLPNEFGGRPLDAFLKICELLQVSFTEIQDDWRDFANEAVVTDDFPFCLLCLTGFQSVIKLQKQLIDIQRTIEEKISVIKEQIERAANKSGGVIDAKQANFRLKAIGHRQASSSITSTTHNLNYDPQPSQISSSSSWPLWPSQEAPSFTILQQETILPSAKQYGSSEVKTVVTLSTATKYSNEDSRSNYQDDDSGAGNHDDYFGSQEEPVENDNYADNGQISQITESKPTLQKRSRKRMTITSSSSTIDNPISRTRQASKSSVSRALKKERQSEYFSPLITDSQGRMVFEGVIITPVPGKGYACGQCGATVGKANDSLSLRKTKIHIKGFHLGAYKCDLCAKHFSSNDILSQHLVRFHQDDKQPCPDCGRPVRTRYLKHHQFTHMNAAEKEATIAAGFNPKRENEGERTHGCRICDKKFYTNSDLLRHEVTHVAPEFRRDFKCPYCDKAYSSLQSRKEHIEGVHDNLNQRKKLCKICGVSVFKKHLKTHLGTHNKLTRDSKCRYCGKAITSRHLKGHEDKCKTHRLKGEGLEVGCDICNKYFSTRKILYSHRKRVHHCSIPPKFAEDISVDNPGEETLEDLNNEGIQHVEGNIYDYRLYQLEKLEDKMGYKCLTCTEEFHGGDCTDEDTLEEKVKEHVRSKHMGNFRCNICTKRMKTLFHVRVHQRIEHLNLKGFDCEICEKPAIAQNIFKKHMYTHKNVWEVAESINAGYTLPNNYVKCEGQEILKAMGIEVNLQCSICEMNGFDKIEDLSSHRREKHPDAPIVPFVKEKNPRKGGAKRKYPDGPIDCPQCGKTFGNAKNMKGHVRKVHEKWKRKKKGGRGSGGRRKERDSSDEEGDSEMEKVIKSMKEEVNTDKKEDDGNEDNDGSSEDEESLRCRHCGKGLSRPETLRLHEAKCEERRKQDSGLEFQFECSVCKKCFKDRKALGGHRRKVHKLCGKTGDVLKQSGISPHCKYCGKRAASRESLIKHESKCEEERRLKNKNTGYKFQCDICKKCFLTKRSLGGHRRKVHKVYGKVPDSCRLPDGDEESPDDGSMDESDLLEDSDFENNTSEEKRNSRKILVVADEDSLDIGEVDIKMEVDTIEQSFLDESESAWNNVDDTLLREEQEMDTESAWSEQESKRHRRGGIDRRNEEGRNLRKRSSVRTSVNYVESDDDGDEDGDYD